MASNIMIANNKKEPGGADYIAVCAAGEGLRFN